MWFNYFRFTLFHSYRNIMPGVYSKGIWGQCHYLGLLQLIKSRSSNTLCPKKPWWRFWIVFTYSLHRITQQTVFTVTDFWKSCPIESYACIKYIAARGLDDCPLLPLVLQSTYWKKAGSVVSEVTWLKSPGINKTLATFSNSGWHLLNKYLSLSWCSTWTCF